MQTGNPYLSQTFNCSCPRREIVERDYALSRWVDALEKMKVIGRGHRPHRFSEPLLDDDRRDLVNDEQQTHPVMQPPQGGHSATHDQ